ncbi:MAG TPA: hypothetical protein VGE47_00800 [Burkholderiaceae bacterium]
MNTVYCYDRNAQIKRFALAALITATAIGSGVVLMMQPLQASGEVHQLPRVVINAKSAATQIAEARAAGLVAQLPAVVVEGQSLTTAVRMARNENKAKSL